MTRYDRIKRLEKAYAPHVLANYRFITPVMVEPDDDRCGTHADMRIAGSPIAELLIFSCTRKGYETQREALRHQFQLLEG